MSVMVLMMLGVLIHRSGAVICYSCSSQRNGFCDDPFNGDCEKVTRIDCSKGCMKAVGTSKRKNTQLSLLTHRWPRSGLL